MKLFGRVVGISLATALISMSLAGSAVAEPVGGTGANDAIASPLSAVPQAMPQTDNTIWALAYSNGVLYIGGDFTGVRPAGAAIGTQVVSQPRLAAIDTSTDTLISTWTPNVDGTVDALSVSPDGTRLYVGGAFSHIDGKYHGKLAGYDISNPAAPVLLNSSQFGAGVGGGRVTALSATNSAVYAGGYFTTAGGQPHTLAAAFNAAGGGVLPFNPVLTGVSAGYPAPFVTAIRATGDGRVAIGGLFDNVNGVAQHALAMVDGTTGASQVGFQIPSILPASYVVAITFADGRMFISGRDDKSSSSFRLEGVRAMDASTGQTLWGSDGHRCLGDTFALEVLYGQIWAGTHAHDCHQIGGYPELSPRFYGSTIGQDVATGTQDHFYPETFGSKDQPGSLNNIRAYATDGVRLFVGGGFTKVNGVAQQDLTAYGPKNGGGGSSPLKVAKPTVIGASTGVKVSWISSTDRDNRVLTYNVYRNNGSTPIDTVQGVSEFWNVPTMSFTDTAVVPGQSVSYRVSVSDGSNDPGKSVASATITVPPPPTTYTQAVLDDAPSIYWHFDETSGSTTADASGHGDGGTLAGGSLGATGVSGGALALNGGTNHVYSSVARTNPRGYSEEVWFKSTSSQGGKLMGFGNATSGTSNQYDRHVYMTNQGQLVFGVYNGTTTTITSPGSYNDGAWHHVVATQSASGMTLYVDGSPVASNSVADAENTTVYFRVGSDNLNGWPSQPTSQGLAGTFDEAAFYSSVLSDAQVSLHYSLGHP